jgi:phosphocarrier protein HPr
MSPTVVEKEFTIQNKQGLHARPAAMLVKLCNNFQSDIWVEKDDEQVNGKSIMGLMMLAANRGSKLKVMADGPDAAQAIEKIGELIAAGFSEE